MTLGEFVYFTQKTRELLNKPSVEVATILQKETRMERKAAGEKYIKIWSKNSVWGFVVACDNDKKFQFGDIL